MPYQIYSVVINKNQYEIKSEDKWKKQINEKIREIEQSVNEMIPVAWDNLYIGINLASDGGGVYYFFNEEGINEYIYNLYIPKQYSITI